MPHPDSTYSDLELFAMIAAGDEPAFTVFYLRYTEKLMPHLTRLLNSEAWAEEIVQDTMTKLWEKRRTLAEIENPSAYLFRIASNRTIDHLRHRARETKMQYQLVRAGADAASANTTENDFDFRASENLLKEAVNGLSPQKQKIYRLRQEDGYSYEEIATQLNISKNTVRNHIAETQQLIRRYLLDRGVLHALWLAWFLGGK